MLWMSPDLSLRVSFRRLVPEARAPERAHAGDAGYDLRSVEGAELPPGGRAAAGAGGRRGGGAGCELRAVEGAELPPGGRAVVGTGVSMAIPDGYAGFVLPRSGLAGRHGVSLVNTPGLIASGSRGAD